MLDADGLGVQWRIRAVAFVHIEVHVGRERSQHVVELDGFLKKGMVYIVCVTYETEELL